MPPLKAFALTAFVCLSNSSFGWVPSPTRVALRFASAAHFSKQAGSFFNPVPDSNDKDDMEKKLQNILKEHSKPSPATEPSTINGVPSQQVGFSSGVGVKLDETTRKPDVGIGPIVNDVTKPEYDDQGYTLYTDEKTGERSRVFEALINYPTLFTLKIVGANEGGFVQDMVSIVATTCDAPVDTIQHSVKHNGKWTSVTVKAPVENAAMLYQLYENVDRDPRVKFKF